MAEILRSAVRDVQAVEPAKGRDQHNLWKRNRKDAITWMYVPHPGYVFSFDTVCNALDLDPTQVRRQLGVNGRPTLGRETRGRKVRTHCPAGHAYTGKDLKDSYRGPYQYCKVCNRIRSKKVYYEAKKKNQLALNFALIERARAKGTRHKEACL